MQGQYLRQVQVLNRKALNRLAEKLLAQAQAEIVPDVLYSLQLVLWAADQPGGLPEVVAGQWETLLPVLWAMTEGPPLKVMSLLALRDKEVSLHQAQEELARELERASPTRAAERLAENLYWSLARIDPSLLGPTTEN